MGLKGGDCNRKAEVKIEQCECQFEYFILHLKSRLLKKNNRLILMEWNKMCTLLLWIKPAGSVYATSLLVYWYKKELEHSSPIPMAAAENPSCFNPFSIWSLMIETKGETMIIVRIQKIVVLLQHEEIIEILCSSQNRRETSQKCLSPNSDWTGTSFINLLESKRFFIWEIFETFILDFSKLRFTEIMRVWHPCNVLTHSAACMKPSDWRKCWCKLSKLTNHRVYWESVYQNDVFKTMLTGFHA